MLIPPSRLPKRADDIPAFSRLQEGGLLREIEALLHLARSYSSAVKRGGTYTSQRVSASSAIVVRNEEEGMVSWTR